MATLKEEYDRRRQEREKKAPKPSVMSVRDLVAIVLSILAFITSVGTAYLTIIRQSDELVMMVMNLPFAKLYDDKKQLWIPDGETDLTFLNRGTRPAAIQGIRFVIIERTPEQAKTPDTCGPRGLSTNIATDFHPAAVKEKDVLTVRLKWVPGFDADPAPSGGVLFPVSQSNVSADRFELTICLVVDFILTSPGLERHRMTVGVGRSVFYRDDRPSHEVRGDMYELVRRTGTIFDREPKQ
jgi:hypothetical protein